jgi:glutamate 5-kinase
MKNRADITKTKNWVVKIGSALLTNDGRGLDTEAINAWVEQIVALRSSGVQVTLVSSGAVAEGMQRLGWEKRPHEVNKLQAAAAVGQMGLVQCYESAFQKHGIHTAQVLLTHEDLSSRERYINARSTLRTLHGVNVIPIVNENDTVVTDEIRFGDNDTLAALVANLVEADLLVILTDQQGLFDSDPRSNADAQLIHQAEAKDDSLMAMAGEGSALGRGGMLTKIRAARLASRSGTATVIASGRNENVLATIRSGDEVGTFLTAESEVLAARKQWLAGQLNMRGTLQLDAGAVAKLSESGSSLLAVGVTAVEGKFVRGEVVRCVDASGREIARGLINYNAEESRRIMGQPSERIETLLGYVGEPELIHRDNLVLS